MFKLSAVFAFLAISQAAFASPLVTENVNIEGRANLHTYLDFSGVSAGQDAVQFLWDRGTDKPRCPRN